MGQNPISKMLRHLFLEMFSLSLTAPALSANERIDGFLDFAIQAKFAYVNKLKRVQPAFFDEKNACVSRESTDCRRKKLTKEKLWFIIETLIGS